MTHVVTENEFIVLQNRYKTISHKICDLELEIMRLKRELEIQIEKLKNEK